MHDLVELAEQRDALGRRDRRGQQRVADRHPGDVVADRLGNRRRQRLDGDGVGDVLDARRPRPRPARPRRRRARSARSPGSPGRGARARGRRASSAPRTTWRWVALRPPGSGARRRRRARAPRRVAASAARSTRASTAKLTRPVGAAVEHARDEPGVAHATRRARPGGCAAGDVEACEVAGCHAARDGTEPAPLAS